MSTDLLKDQSAQRERYLNAILESSSVRKLIVAGPGTGKTFTFGELLKNESSGDNLALTFIRKLVRDMEAELTEFVEAKTFHAYCKKLLHERYGGIELFPALTQVVEEDAYLLNLKLSHFDDAFQTLDETADELSFYLERGDYYNAVSFNDSVYRVLTTVREEAGFLPKFDQIVIDEFQDFNPMEVAFIDELEKRGPILIVGDDDQAVYRRRNSSPDHLREKFNSGNYETFELPFCSRCPRVVVEGTTAFTSNIIRAGGFVSRIDRLFVPFLEDKKYENEAYPKIISATTSNILCLGKLVRLSIGRIPERDITEAYEEEYPCVLIVGSRQYLNPLKKLLSKHYSNVSFTQSEDFPYSIIDGYRFLRADEESNLGWRLLAGLGLPKKKLREVIRSTRDFTPLVELLPKDFIERHLEVIEVIREPDLDDSGRQILDNLLADQSAAIVMHFYPPEEEEEPEVEDSEPTILLSSFEGCKGLSAGHVFIVGLNDGIMPRIDENDEIDDIEISKLIVAMTRTRKQLNMLSNRWDYAPKGKAFQPSTFIDFMPEESLLDGGYLKSDDVEGFIELIWGKQTEAAI